jgi:broad specificity phosphatase PhoE
VGDPPGAGPLSDQEPGQESLSAPAPAPVLAIPPDLDAALVLVRHGESEAIVERRFQGRMETPLSATGRRQAQLVAARLAQPHASPALPLPEGPPLAIVHSPLGRAAATATAIRDAAAAPAPGGLGSDVPLRPDERFLEIGQGEWEGVLASEITERHGDTLAAWRRTPTLAWAPGGERLAEVRARVLPGLADLLAELAAAGRPGSIHAPQVAGYRDAVPDHPWSILVGHDGVFKVLLLTLFDLPLERFWMWSSDLCGISVIEFRAGRPVIRALNLTEHLAGLLDEQAQAETEARARSGAL